MRWIHPEYPIFCHLGPGGGGFCPAACAGQNQLGKIFEYGAEKGGILAHVVPHDARRGFFRDLAHLPKDSLKGEDIVSVGAAGGHTYKSISEGQTSLYIGGITQDVHTARVSSTNTYDPRQPSYNNSLKNQKSKILKSEAIDNKLKEIGIELEQATSSDRKRASKVLHTARKHIYINQRKNFYVSISLVLLTSLILDNAESQPIQCRTLPLRLTEHPLC